MESIDTVFPFGEYLHITSKTDDFDADDLVSDLKEEGHNNLEIKEIEANIEDCFMELMQ